MSHFQICDCPSEPPETLDELLHTAREERLLPGEGDADLPGIIGALPENLIVSVEIPSQSPKWAFRLGEDLPRRLAQGDGMYR